MEKKENTKTSKALTSNELVELIYQTITGCYGVVGIVDKDINNKKLTPLELNKAKKGISYLRHTSNDEFSVSVYILLAKDVKISEAIRESQKSLRYALNKKTGNRCRKVDIYAMGIN
jgi:uncharacterized alkaline shock family protein YloU